MRVDKTRRIRKQRQICDELEEKYDFSQLKRRIRGKYFQRHQEGTNLVLLEPDNATS